MIAVTIIVARTCSDFPYYPRTKFVDGMSTVSRTSQEQNKKKK